MSEFANKMLLATDGSPDAESAARMAMRNPGSVRSPRFERTCNSAVSHDLR